MATRHAVAGSISWASRCVASSSRTSPSSRSFSSSSSRALVRRNQRTYADEDAGPESVERSDPSTGRSDASYDRSTTASSETPSERQQKLADKYYAHAFPGWKSTYDYAVLPDPPPLPKTHGIHVATLRMTANEIKNLEFYAQWCYLSARSFGMPARRPERLPRSKELVTVLKGPFVHKKFQENFERLTFKRDIKVYDTSRETLDLWIRYISRHAMGGIDMKVRVHEWVDYGWGRKDVEAVEAQFDGIPDEASDSIRNRAYELVKKMAGQEEADRMLRAIPAEPEPEVKEFIKPDSGGKGFESRGSGRPAKSAKGQARKSVTGGPSQVGSTALLVEDPAIISKDEWSVAALTSTPNAPNTDTGVSFTSSDASASSSPAAVDTNSDTLSATQVDQHVGPASTPDLDVPTPTADTTEMASPAPTIVSEETVVEVAPALEVSPPITETTTAETVREEPASPSPAVEIPTDSSAVDPASSDASGSASLSAEPIPVTASEIETSQPTEPVEASSEPTTLPQTELTGESDAADPIAMATSEPPAAAEETVEERSKAETESAISDASPDEPAPTVKTTKAKTTSKAETTLVDSSEPAPKKRVTRKKAVESEVIPEASSSSIDAQSAEPAVATDAVPKKRVTKQKKEEPAEESALSESIAEPKKKTRAKKAVEEPEVAASETTAEVKTPKKRVTKKKDEEKEGSEETGAEVKAPKKRVTKKDAEETKEASAEASEAEVKVPKKRVTKKKAEEEAKEAAGDDAATAEVKTPKKRVTKKKAEEPESEAEPQKEA